MAKKVSKAKRGRTKSRSNKKVQTKKTTRKASNNKDAVKPSKVFVYALALAALGGGGFLVYDRLKRRKQSSEQSLPTDSAKDTIIINNSLPVSYSATSPTSSLTKLISSATSTITRNDNFPLKRGSHGERVKVLQKALAKTTPAIAIDGQFGPQTAGALKTAGYPEIVDEALFNQITSSTAATSGSSLTVVFNPSALATSLYMSTQAKDLTAVLYVLKQIKSVSDYSSVNEYYKKQSFISRTIVTDLLSYAFKYDEAAKTQIKNEFLRMGLKVDSSGTWSLQGLRLYKDLITIRETVVTDSSGNKIPVRRNTILGDEVEVSNGMTWFRSVDNSVLKVPTQDVKNT